MKKLTTLFSILLVAVGAFGQTTWNVDKAHTSVGFSVTHMVVSEVDGNFRDFDASVVTKSDDFDGAEVTFTAKVASIDTDNERRDGHLKSDDFFNAEKFETLSFNGTLAKAGGKYQLKGKLTIRDVTKDVTFDVTYGGKVDTGRGTKAGFKLNGKINRLDYGLKWDSKIASGEMVVGDEVAINCKIELNKA